MNVNFMAAGVIATVFGLAAATPVYNYGTSDTVTFTVTDKERIVENDGDGSTSSKYLIYTNSETFENTDSILRWKFNSSDVYGDLEEGKTYEADVYGWRIPILSTYRNLVDVKEISRQQPAP